MREALLARGARVGIVEALMLADDVRLAAMLAAGADALPARVPNAGSLLMFARTPFAVERLLALGVPRTRATSGARRQSRRSAGSARPAPTLVGDADRAGRRRTARRPRASRQSRGARSGGRTAPAAVRDDAVLMAAVDGRQHDVVSWLLAHGASANARAAAQSQPDARSTPRRGTAICGW